MKILEILTPKRKVGNIGENIAAKLLKKSGYKIKKRGYVALGHEIDIIAENRDTVAFVEVKTRTVGHESPREPRPASAVTPTKQKGIIKAAKFYLGVTGCKKHVRLDIIEVYINENKTLNKTVHMENAFSINTAYN